MSNNRQNSGNNRQHQPAPNQPRQHQPAPDQQNRPRQHQPAPNQQNQLRQHQPAPDQQNRPRQHQPAPDQQNRPRQHQPAPNQQNQLRQHQPAPDQQNRPRQHQPAPDQQNRPRQYQPASDQQNQLRQHQPAPDQQNRPRQYQPASDQQNQLRQHQQAPDQQNRPRQYQPASDQQNQLRQHQPAPDQIRACDPPPTPTGSDTADQTGGNTTKKISWSNIVTQKKSNASLTSNSGRNRNPKKKYVYANHFDITLKNPLTLYQYEIFINYFDVNTNVYQLNKFKNVARQVFQELCKDDNTNGKVAFYDNSQMMFCFKDFFKDKANQKDETPTTIHLEVDNKKYQIIIKKTNTLTITKNDFQQAHQQALQLIFTNIIFNKEKFTCFAKKFVLNSEEKKVISYNTYLWKGFSLTVRPGQHNHNINSDIANVVFFDRIQLYNYVKNFPAKKDKILESKSSLEDKKIQLKLGNPQNPTSVKTYVFDDLIGSEIDRLKVKLKSLEGEFETKNCTIGMFLKKDLDNFEKKTVIIHTAEPPSVRKQKIEELLHKSAIAKDNILKHYGIDVNDKMVKVISTTLPSPALTNRKFEDYRWCVDGCYKTANAVDYIVIIYFNERMTGFANQIQQELIKDSIKIFPDNLRPQIKVYLQTKTNKNCLIEALETLEKKEGEKLKKEGKKLIIPIINGSVQEYNSIKKYGDKIIGVPTQVIKEASFKTAQQNREPFYTNLMLKINTKLDGINFKLEENEIKGRKYLKWILDGAMIFGADVSHPTQCKGNQKMNTAASLEQEKIDKTKQTDDKSPKKDEKSQKKDGKSQQNADNKENSINTTKPEQPKQNADNMQQQAVTTQDKNVTKCNEQPEQPKIETSIAAVVGSIDTDFCQYAARMCRQWVEQKKDEDGKYKSLETIIDMETMVKELIMVYHEKQNAYPKRLIFLRDGVSDGQFKDIKDNEIQQIQKACKEICKKIDEDKKLNNNQQNEKKVDDTNEKKTKDHDNQQNEKKTEETKTKINIIFLTVLKRHHTRFFPDNEEGKQDQAGALPTYAYNKMKEVPSNASNISNASNTSNSSAKNQKENVEPGTYVSEIVTPNYNDPKINNPNFFLCSHKGSRGTSKPCHYYILHNDEKGNMIDEKEELAELCHYLCHLCERSIPTISYPAPTYYADLCAARGRIYEDKSPQVIPIDSETNSLGRIVKIEVNENLKNTMFYI